MHSPNCLKPSTSALTPYTHTSILYGLDSKSFSIISFPDTPSQQPQKYVLHNIFRILPIAEK